MNDQLKVVPVEGKMTGNIKIHSKHKTCRTNLVHPQPTGKAAKKKEMINSNMKNELDLDARYGRCDG